VDLGRLNLSALKGVDVRAQRERRGGPAAAPIAVIGMACRFPQAPDIDAFWELIRSGGDAVTEVPADRFDAAALYDASPGIPGRISSRWGGYLDGIAEFDAAFFGVTPREADHMDPAQRILLETAWDAIQDAGWVPEPQVAARTGVFVGQIADGYWDLARQARALDLYSNVGTARSAGAARLSYAFDLRGPAVAVDTDRSSSLVAVHLACQSLRSGESDVALAAGVNVILHPDHTIAFSQADMLAADGHCKFASADADGFVRSEGVAVVVLKPLDDALADGDRIHAVIHGTAVGNDGQTSGAMLTPGSDGQALTLRRAYESAGIDPADVAYVEAHGTGTSIGDRTEITALASVLGDGRAADRPLLVGSVKTNIGHTEAAAGIAGLIKTVLCLKNRVVPASLHSAQLTPAVEWDSLPVRVVREPAPWPQDAPGIAAVSSFGLSGTNAHCVLGEFQARPAPAAPDGEHIRILALSARDETALGELAQRYAERLDALGEDRAALRDLCHSAATRRKHLRYRLTAVGSTAAELAAKLRAYRAGDSAAGLGMQEQGTEQDPAVVFVFPGQGSQWAGMGRELLERSPVFRAAIKECDRAIQAEVGWSLLSILEAGAPVEGVNVIQPALWAMEVALAALWRSWGVRPDYVLGHSMGEAAAAYVAGALTLAESAAVICQRSVLARTTAGNGAMASVELPADEARREIEGCEDLVSIGAINGPNSTILSGDPAALQAILDRLDAREVFCRKVKVDFASHSPQMEPLAGPLAERLAHLRPRAGEVPFYSTVLGEVVEGERLDAGYWARNLREPVRFGPAVADLVERGPVVFVELSPHPVLLNAVREYLGEPGTPSQKAAFAVPSTRRDEPELATLLDGVGALHRFGYRVPWGGLFEAEAGFASLPPYPWQRKRYWFAQASIEQLSALASVAIPVPRAGEQTPVAEAAANAAEEAPSMLRPDEVEDFLAAELAQAMSLPVASLNRREPLNAQGLDSLMAADVRRQVQRRLGVLVPLTKLLRGRIEALAADIAQQVAAAATAGAGAGSKG
jgi:acyl transferase domain-containing protein